MKDQKERGKFVSFEGPEGGGKSTHLPSLATFLREKQGLEVVTTREPGGTPLGEQIRAMLRSVRGEAPVPEAEVLLFLASRAQDVAKIIAPALRRGAWVLSDRFEDSTFAYQGAGRGFDLSTLRLLNRFATRGIRPDLVLVLDIPYAQGRIRLKARQTALDTDADRIERETGIFHECLRRGFLALAKENPERYAVIPSDREQALVDADIRNAVMKRLKGAGSRHAE